MMKMNKLATIALALILMLSMSLAAVAEEPVATSAPVEVIVADATLPPPQTTEAATIAPESAEVPAATEVPAYTEVPAVTEAPAATQVPTATEAPAATEVPASTEVPEATQDPAATEAATAVPAVPAGKITIKIEGDEFYYGDEVTLAAELDGFENVSYTITWQYYDVKDEEWKDATGENGKKKYKFILTEENASYEWRAVVSVAE